MNKQHTKKSLTNKVRLFSIKSKNRTDDKNAKKREFS